MNNKEKKNHGLINRSNKMKIERNLNETVKTSRY